MQKGCGSSSGLYAGKDWGQQRQKRKNGGETISMKWVGITSHNLG